MASALLLLSLAVPDIAHGEMTGGCRLTAREVADQLTEAARNFPGETAMLCWQHEYMTSPGGCGGSRFRDDGDHTYSTSDCPVDDFEGNPFLGFCDKPGQVYREYHYAPAGSSAQDLATAAQVERETCLRRAASDTRWASAGEATAGNGGTTPDSGAPEHTFEFTSGGLYGASEAEACGTYESEVASHGWSLFSSCECRGQGNGLWHCGAWVTEASGAPAAAAPPPDAGTSPSGKPQGKNQRGRRDRGKGHG